MNRTFLNDDFLLNNRFSRVLFHDYAKAMPIIDYHNHLSPLQVVTNHQFKNITQAWLNDDHYKWRAMRTMGVDEKFITGSANDRDKFIKWAEVVPYLIRNPLYHWTHLELQRYFGVSALLSKANAEEIYDTTSAKLKENSHRALGLLNQMNVELICTTDDPIDDLSYHQKAKERAQHPKLLPTFRPDKAFAVEDAVSYDAYLKQLAKVANVQINSFGDLLSALKNRIIYFHDNGCCLADHGMEQLYFYECETFDIEVLFEKLGSGESLSKDEAHYFKFKTLVFLCKEYHELGWVQQFHLGPLRNTNTRFLKKLGPDSGFDSIGDFQQAYTLSKFLNLLDSSNQLAKTILYNTNPSQNEVFATMAGNFNDGSTKGKIQFGSGWWFLDQLDGMEKQLNTLSNMGVLSCFVGMLTDSRSLLSFPRHEYFRRLLCSILGNDIEKGLLPADIQHIGQIVQDICYYNAKNYFDFDR